MPVQGLKCTLSFCFLPQDLLAAVSTSVEVKKISKTSVTLLTASGSLQHLCTLASCLQKRVAHFLSGSWSHTLLSNMRGISLEENVLCWSNNSAVVPKSLISF